MMLEEMEMDPRIHLFNQLPERLQLLMLKQMVNTPEKHRYVDACIKAYEMEQRALPMLEEATKLLEQADKIKRVAREEAIASLPKDRRDEVEKTIAKAEVARAARARK